MWRHLSDAGKRVAVLNMPYAFPEYRLNGLQVVNWGTHSRIAEDYVATYPVELIERIGRLAPEDYGADSTPDRRKVTRQEGRQE